jgi:hypothetical protein
MRALASLLLALALAACGRPFDVKTAPGFVPLENQVQYDYRSTTPEGVVFAVRVVEDEKRGDLGFWTHAVTLQLREVSGYALLDTADVKSADGTPGKLMRFGRDEDNKPFVYWVAVFPAQGRLFIVETGGLKDTFDRARGSIDAMLASVRVRCNGFLSPVLSSRTCNRW